MIKEKLSAGETVYGTWIRIPHASVIEVLTSSGFDFVHIDMEHGPFGLAELDQMLLGARSAQIPAVVRVPGLNATRIGGSLDMGAAGVIVPQVDSAEEAVLAVKASRFHPQGARGMAGDCRGDGYGSLDYTAFAAKSNREGLLAIQVESKEAVENLNSILDAVEDHVDVFYIGPADLSQSLGIPGQLDHPLLQETIRRVTECLRSRGLTVGIHAPNPLWAKEFEGMGMQYITLSIDTALLATGAKAWLEQVKRIGTQT